MDASELPMILFSVFTQMAVGSFIVLGAVQTFASLRHPAAVVDEVTEPALYAIGPAMIAGLGVSMLHMHDITHTLNVVRHVGTSWLSNEIVMGSAFAGLGFLFALLQWRKIGSPRLRQALAAVTALVGIGFVFATSMVYYSLVTVPAWHTPATFVAFFSTALTLGSLAVGVAFMTSLAWRRRRGAQASAGAREIIGASLKGIAVVSLVAAGATLIRLPLYLKDLALQGGAALESAATMDGPLLGVRLALLVVGVGLMAMFIFHFARTDDATRSDTLLLTLTWLALALALASELIGRSMFYEAMVRVGM